MQSIKTPESSTIHIPPHYFKSETQFYPEYFLGALPIPDRALKIYRTEGGKVALRRYQQYGRLIEVFQLRYYFSFNGLQKAVRALSTETVQFDVEVSTQSNKWNLVAKRKCRKEP